MYSSQFSSSCVIISQLPAAGGGSHYVLVSSQVPASSFVNFQPPGGGAGAGARAVQVVAEAHARIAVIKAKPVVAVQQVAVAPKRVVVQRRPVIVTAGRIPIQTGFGWALDVVSSLFGC